MTIKNVKFLIIAIVIFVVLAGLFLVQRGKIDLPSADDVVPAPNFSLKDYEGNMVSLSDFEGKPVVINSWATWCPFCVDELPAFAEAQKELGDRAVIITIDRAEPLSLAKSYTDNLGITDDLVFLLDPDDSFYKSIGGFSMPETIFVDGEGNIKFHKRGPMEKEEILELINTYLLD